MAAMAAAVAAAADVAMAAPVAIVIAVLDWSNVCSQIKRLWNWSVVFALVPCILM